MKTKVIENVCITICILILMFLLFVFIYRSCIVNEYFTAPGLTLTIPPSWFPQNSAKKYNKKDWETKMYLDRYPFYDDSTGEYINQSESDYIASTNRFWRM